MADEDRAKEDLIAELRECRQRISFLQGEAQPDARLTETASHEKTEERPLSVIPSVQPHKAGCGPGMVGKSTETIDLSRLFVQDTPGSGSFVIDGEIWATTFGKLMQSLPISAFLVDESAQITALNQACKHIGANYLQLAGTPFANLFSSSSRREQAQSIVDLIFSDRRPRAWEAALQISDQRIWARFNFRPVRIRNDRFLLVIMEDLTQEKVQLEQNTILKNELENTVTRRTAELAVTNERLTAEISKRAEIETDLRKSEERYRELAELLPEHVFEVDGRGYFTFSNRVGSEALGYAREELEGVRHLLQILSPEDHSRALQDFKRVKKGETISGANYSLLRKNGSSFEVSAFIAPTIRDGKATGARGVAVDISELKKNQSELAQLNRELDLRIQQRTSQLVSVNARLQEEVDQRKAGQHELETEKEKLTGILEAMEDGVYMVDQDGNIQFINRALVEDFGPLEGKKCYQYFHDRSEPCLECHMGRVLDGKATRFEWYCAKNGKTYELRDTVVRNADGSIWKLEIFRNISKRRRAEEALKESERRYRELIENATDIVFETDSNGFITFMNAAGENVTGFSQQEFIGKHYLDFVSPEYRKQVERFYGIQFVKRLPDSYHEYPMITKDGRELWLGQRVHLVTKDQSVVGFQAICRDITERHLVEKQLRESEEKFRHLVERANDGIAIVQDAKVKYANPAAARMLGYDYMEEIDQPFEKYVHPELLLQLKETYGKRMAGEPVPTVYDTIMMGKGGNEVVVEVNAGNIDFEGVPATLVIIRDVNEKRKIERRLETSELKFRSVVENAKEGITVIQDGLLKYLNPWALEITGWSEDEMLSRPFLDFIHPEDRESVANRYRRRLVGEDFANSFLFRIVHKRGLAKWIETDSIRMDWEGGEAVLTFWRDITDRKKADEALKESEARFRALFENMINGVAVYKPINDGHDFLFSDINKAAERMDRVDRSDIVGKSVSEVFPGVKEFGLFEVFQRVWQTGQTEHHPEAKYRDERMESWRDNVVYKLPTGEIVAVYSDESERKRAEDSRRETENRYRAIVDNAQDSIFLKDRDLRYTHVNPAMERLFELPSSVLIGKTDWDLFGETVAEEVRRVDHAVLEGRTVHHESTKPVQGVPLTFDVVKVPVSDSSGKVIGLCGIARNMTEKRKAEEQVRQSEEKYRDLFNSSRDGIYIVSREGEIEEANPAFGKMFAFASTDLRGESVLDLYDDLNDRQRFQREIERLGSVRDYEMALRSRDGRRLECLITSSIRRDNNGNVVGYAGSVRNVTDQRILERQLFQAQKMEAIGTLAGGIAHDFNNLLQVVLGYADMLILDKAIHSLDLGKLETIRKAAMDGGELVKGLLTFSRQVESKLRPLDLKEELKRICKMLKRTIPKMTEVRLIVDDDLKVVNADPVQFEQVLLNLCVNAHHAMPKGGMLTIEAECVTLDERYCFTCMEARAGEHVSLKISDTGHGMEKEVLEHIFEPFFTTKKVGEGTGLGLAIVYGIVRNHGGHIQCHSEPGRGTTFTLYFPTFSGRVEPAMETVTSAASHIGTETILVVDDDEPIRGLIGRILTRLGYTVLTAENGIQALKVYREKKDSIDLVILDLIMPEMGGEQFLEEISGEDLQARILIASGYSPNDKIKELLESGSCASIKKPFEVIELLRVVRRILDEKGFRGEIVSRPADVPSAPTDLNVQPRLDNESSMHAPLSVEELPRGLRILVIDDREPYLRMFKAGLVQLGQTAVIASSGAEGLRVFRETPIDAVICDLTMPEMNGWEVAKGIKEICRERDMQKTPFVLVTGQSHKEGMNQEDRRELADCGVDAIVGKPIDIPDLLKIVGRLTEKMTHGAG